MRACTAARVGATLSSFLLLSAADARAQNLIQNPGFNGDLGSWTATASPNYTVGWDGSQGNGALGSATVNLTSSTSPKGATVTVVSQCVPATFPTTYEVGGSFRYPSSAVAKPIGSVFVKFYRDPVCANGFELAGGSSFPVSSGSSPADAWATQNFQAGVTTPMETYSVRITLMFRTFTAGTSSGWYDDIRFTPAQVQEEPLRTRVSVLVDTSARMVLTPEMITYTESCAGWNPCTFNGNPSAAQETCNACVSDTINSDFTCANAWDASCRADYSNCLIAVTGQATCSATMTSSDAVATRGDGSSELPGCDLDGDGLAHDSRMYQAKQALADVYDGFSEVEFSLWRYAQVTGGQPCTVDADCPTTPGGLQILTCEDHDQNGTGTRRCAFDADTLDAATPAGFEGQCNRFTYTGSPSAFSCNACDFLSSYDRAGCAMFDLDRVRTSAVSPLNNTSTVQCFPAGDPVHRFMPYHGGVDNGGACDPTGGQRLVLFPASRFDSNYPITRSWIDHSQPVFSVDNELRPHGASPIAASLRDMRTSLLTTLAADPRTPCRNYKVIIVAGGGDSCEPAANAVSAAAALQDLSFTNALGRTVTGFDVDVHVIGFGVCPPSQPACPAAQELDSIAAAGGTGTALFASNQADLQAAIESILAGTTSSCPPSVTTQAATATTDTSATLNASVNPNGSTTSAYFEYGPTASYGSSTSSQSVGSGQDDVPASATVTGLTCEALYHFRAGATSLTGAANGGDLTFTTSACPPPQADLTITKTDGEPTAVPGGTVTYTIVAGNAGPSDAPGATVTDAFPAAITSANWTCVAAGGATCTGGGSGSINDTVNLPVGGTATYMATGTIDAGATGTLANTATVTVPSGVTDPDPVNNSATDTDAIAVLGDGYFTVAPCRVVDTRGGAPNSGPALVGQQTRTLAIAGNCGIPVTAKAVSVNLAVTQPASAGNVRLFPAGQAVPTVSSINYSSGQTRGNNAIVLLDANGAIAAFVGQPAGTTVHLILDVNGYFE